MDYSALSVVRFCNYHAEVDELIRIKNILSLRYSSYSQQKKGNYNIEEYLTEFYRYT